MQVPIVFYQFRQVKFSMTIIPYIGQLSFSIILSILLGYFIFSFSLLIKLNHNI